MCRVLHEQVAISSEGHAVTPVSRGHDAVEHVDAKTDTVDEVFGCANAHEIMRPFWRKERSRVLAGFVHVRDGLTDRQPSNGEPVDIEATEVFDVTSPCRFVGATLDDGEDGSALPGSKAASRPRRGELHGFGELLRRTGERRADVERHHDVAAERFLDGHRRLGGKLEQAPVEMTTEPNSVRVQLPEFAETEDLETAGIRQNGTVPRHHLVEPTERLNAFVPRSIEKVIGVAEADRGPDGRKRGGIDCLHGAGRPDGHEARRRDLATGRLEHSGASVRSGIGRFDTETKPRTACGLAHWGLTFAHA